MEALALAALDRKEEAIEMLRSRETDSKLPRSLHRLLRSLRALLEGDQATGIEVMKGALPDPSRTGVIDAERLFFMVRQLSRLGAREIALDQLKNVIDAGYYPVFALEHDPWLATIRSAAAFQSILRRARQLHLQAAAAYVGAGGPELVGGDALEL